METIQSSLNLQSLVRGTQPSFPHIHPWDSLAHCFAVKTIPWNPPSHRCWSFSSSWPHNLGFFLREPLPYWLSQTTPVLRCCSHGIPSVTGRAWAPAFGTGFGWDVKWWRLDVAILTTAGLLHYGRLLQDFLEMVPKSYKSHLAAGTHKLVVNRSEILWWDSYPLVILHSFNKDTKLGLKTAH